MAVITSKPTTYSTAIATITTSSEMIKPCSMGRMPERAISLKLVLRPIAASAAIMRNLLICLSADDT